LKRVVCGLTPFCTTPSNSSTPLPWENGSYEHLHSQDDEPLWLTWKEKTITITWNTEASLQL